jgi:hypothetical protein
LSGIATLFKNKKYREPQEKKPLAKFLQKPGKMLFVE